MMDLFAGCGGLSLGMEQAGFTPIFVNELNDDARGSYLLNRDFDLKGKLLMSAPSFTPLTFMSSPEADYRS